MNQLITPLSSSELKNISMDNFQGLLVDIDDTLYSYQDAHKIALADCYIKFKSLSENNQIFKNNSPLSFHNFCILYKQNRQFIFKSLTPQSSCRSRLLAFQKMFEDNLSNSYKNLSYQLALEFEEHYWKSIIENMQPNNEVNEFIKKNFLNGKIICAISDMQTSIQIKKLKKLNLDQYISYLVTSEEAGEEKPNSKIFNLALHKINLPPSKVLMIGDNYEKDYRGANQLGIDALLIDLNGS